MVRRSENAREDPGLVSPGRGDHGGRSYGLYQLSSRRPDGGGLSPVERFIDASGYGPFFQGMEVNSERFRNQWRDLAGADPSFVQAQHEYMRSEYYHPAAQALERSGLALEGRGEGLREVVFSTAVQYGGIGVIRRALRGRDPSTMSDEELIVAIQDDKLANVDRDFRSSNAEIRDGVRERIPREREQALRMTREGRPPVGPPGR